MEKIADIAQRIPEVANLAPVNDLTSFAVALERMATNPAVDVDKMERLMLMHERVIARNAEDAFNAAMADAQAEMRPVAADADNPQTRSRYATYAALDRALRPIYTKHGFGMSYDTGDQPRENWVRVLCYVTHRAGGKRTYKIDMPADGKGAKGGDVMTLTHATGAGSSYGMRYLLKMIWNVAVGEDDRDGNTPDDKEPPADPKGYQDWFMDLEVVALEGLSALSAAWKKSKQDYRDHTFARYRREWEALKSKAAKIKGVSA